MTMNGASPETRQSIISTIDYSGLSAEEVNGAYSGLMEMLLKMDPKVKLGLANSVWTDDDFTIKSSFAEIVSSSYAARVESLNFGDPQAKDIINKWVESKTNGKIVDLIQEISSTEIMFLINAIYFNGNWTTRFDEKATHTWPFTRADHSTVNVEMMNANGVNVMLSQNTDVSFVDVPYGDGLFSFSILMPHTQPLDEFIAELNTGWLNEVSSNAIKANVELEIPKFKMKWKNDLLENLESMGMLRGGFPNLVEELSDGLEISRVIHQSYVDVTEAGTEAAAATAVGIQYTSMPSGPPLVRIDKPFVFLIRNAHTNTILFVGQLLDPAQLAN
jgi:serpin B